MTTKRQALLNRTVAQIESEYFEYLCAKHGQLTHDMLCEIEDLTQFEVDHLCYVKPSLNLLRTKILDYIYNQDNELVSYYMGTTSLGRKRFMNEVVRKAKSSAEIRFTRYSQCYIPQPSDTVENITVINHETAWTPQILIKWSSKICLDNAAYEYHHFGSNK